MKNSLNQDVKKTNQIPREKLIEYLKTLGKMPCKVVVECRSPYNQNRLQAMRSDNPKYLLTFIEQTQARLYSVTIPKAT